MDAQNRLTRWEEWEPGATYENVRFDVPRGSFVCRDVRPSAGYVLLKDTTAPELRCYNWRSRYRKTGEPTTA